MATLLLLLFIAAAAAAELAHNEGCLLRSKPSAEKSERPGRNPGPSPLKPELGEVKVNSLRDWNPDSGLFSGGDKEAMELDL